jgi:hypothetical protein
MFGPAQPGRREFSKIGGVARAADKMSRVAVVDCLG